MIALRHPESGRTAKVRDAQVPALIDRGWEHVDPADAPEEPGVPELGDAASQESGSQPPDDIPPEYTDI